MLRVCAKILYLVFYQKLNIHLTLLFSYSGHCKKLAPEYAGAAQALAEQDPPLPLGKVDATEQKKIAEKFGIQGFPTLFWFT